MKILPLTKQPKVGKKLIWPRSSTIYHITKDLGTNWLIEWKQEWSDYIDKIQYSKEQLKESIENNGVKVI